MIRGGWELVQNLRFFLMIMLARISSKLRAHSPTLFLSQLNSTSTTVINSSFTRRLLSTTQVVVIIVVCWSSTQAVVCICRAVKRRWRATHFARYIQELCRTNACPRRASTSYLSISYKKLLYHSQFEIDIDRCLAI